MKATLAIATAAALVGSVAAGGVHHRHAHEIFHANDLQKKDGYPTKSNGTDEEGTCQEGCTTYYTTYYGQPTLHMPPKPTSAPAPVVPTPYPQDAPTPGVYTVPAHIVTVTAKTTVTYTTGSTPVTTAYEVGTYTQPAVITTITGSSTSFYCTFDIPKSSSVVYPTTTAAEKPKSSSAAAYPTAAPAAGKPWGMTYTPYDSTGNCATQAQINKDIADISAAGIKLVRTYSTDCKGLEYIGAACRANGVKMLIGVYVKSGTACDPSNPIIAEQISAINAWAQWDLVTAVVVGNEALFNGYCNAGQLASLIHAVRGALTGYGGPYTTAETVNIWQQPEVPGALCSCVDWVGANIHPYFDPNGSADKAGQFVATQLAYLNTLCGGKPAKALETGWPHEGNCLGSSCPGKEEQIVAIKSLVNTVGGDAIFLSLHDDNWKDYNAQCGNCEKAWGCRAALGF